MGTPTKAAAAGGNELPPSTPKTPPPSARLDKVLDDEPANEPADEPADEKPVIRLSPAKSRGGNIGQKCYGYARGDEVPQPTDNSCLYD